MQLTLPAIFIALAGVALVTQRNRWIVLGALLVQWAGLALEIASLPSGGSVALIEVVTALGCCGILGYTLWSLEHIRNNPPGQVAAPNPQTNITDQLWLWAIALVAGVAGFGLAQLYPLGGSAQDLILFYWIILPAVLALVVDGSRDPIRLGAGMLAIFNAGLFLAYTLGTAAPDVAALGLAALGRLALASILGYSWLFFKVNYRDLNLNTLFDLRDSKIATETALALVPEPYIEQPELEPEPESEAEEEESRDA